MEFPMSEVVYRPQPQGLAALYPDAHLPRNGPGLADIVPRKETRWIGVCAEMSTWRDYDAGLPIEITKGHCV